MTRNQTIIALAMIALPLDHVSSAEEVVAEQCLLEPYTTVNLGTPVRGILSETLVQRGDVVTAGEVVARIDSRAEQDVVALAESRAEFADRTVERNQELIEDGLLASQDEDEMETEAEIAELELEQARTEVEMRNIRSPVDGVVVDQMRTTGEFVDENEIYVLAQIDPLNVEVVVSVDYFGQISTGMSATVTPEAPLDDPLKAEVVIVDKVIDAASSTFRVRLDLPNPNLLVPAGLRCEVKFPFE